MHVVSHAITYDNKRFSTSDYDYDYDYLLGLGSTADN